MTGTSDLFPNVSIITQIRATMSSSINANTSVAVTPYNNGRIDAYRKLGVLLDEDESTSDSRPMTAIAFGNGRALGGFVLISSDTLRLFAYTVDSSTGELTQTATTDISLGGSVAGNPERGRINFIYDGVSGTDTHFVIQYRATLRVVSISSAGAITLGTALGTGITDTSRAYTVRESQNNYWYFNPAVGPSGVRKITKSGTTLTNNSTTISGITFPTSDTGAGQPIILRGGTRLVIPMLNGSGNESIAQFSISGTTLTYQNDVAIGAVIPLWAMVLIPTWNTDQFLAAYPNATNNGILVQAGTSGTSTVTLGSNITIGATLSASEVENFNLVFNNLEGFATIFYNRSSQLRDRRVPTSVGSNSIGTIGSEVSTLGSTLNYNTSLNSKFNFTAATSNNNYYYFNLPLSGGAARIYKWTTFQSVFPIGYVRDTVTAGNTAVIELRGNIAGGLSENVPGTLTAGTNYYLSTTSATGLTSLTTEGPFYGWAIDSSRIIRSEVPLS